MLAKVSVRNIAKHFGATTAANSINLEIRDGEFLTLLGESGCGKRGSFDFGARNDGWCDEVWRGL